MTAPSTTILRATVALALVVPSVAALASPVTDLEGARAAGALEDMDRRGYVQTSSYRADGGSYTYWWNRDTKSCVRLLTRDGRIAATKTSMAEDCGQRSAGGGSSGGSNAAAAAIAGAAILAGVAALSHKSHHRSDEEYGDSQSYAEFERGHRDGLLAHSFADYNNSRQYRDGYQSGVNERGYQSGYRGDQRGSGGGRTVTPVYVDDLQGARAAGALSDLEARGFRSVDNFQSGSNGAGTVWWNGRTRQCVQVITVDGHIDSVSDIGTHPRCR